MPRCYHCGEILSDEWLKKIGASLMGKKGGKAKSRGKGGARKAANALWAKRRAEAAAQQKGKK
jgi:hypothetical protein